MSKGNELKPRIGFFGRRNAGKSTMINFLTGQQIAIVSDTAGTTTDPVRKSMEIGGIGPVVLVDTAGIDDEGELGALRVEKSMAALAEVDLALLLYTEGNYGEPEERVERWCSEHGTPMLKVRTKAEPIDKEALIAKIKEALPESAYRRRSLLGDIVAQGDTVVLVTPIDSSAPEGRMILPQVQVLRDLMDLHAVAVFCQPEELDQLFTPTPTPPYKEGTATQDIGIHVPSLQGGVAEGRGGGNPAKPTLVVTDSQAFERVAAVVPEEVPLTSFSVVLARQKGMFSEYLAGTKKIGELKDGDRVLLLESCTHNVTCEDIGRVKLPKALKKATGKDLICEVIGGQSPLPKDLSQYALVIQCGGCVITAQQVKARLLPALEAGVPVSNYGLALAWCNGIFDRATRIFSHEFPRINH